MMNSTNGNRNISGDLDPTKLMRMKLAIIKAERDYLRTSRYSYDEILERIRKIIEKEAK